MNHIEISYEDEHISTDGTIKPVLRTIKLPFRQDEMDIVTFTMKMEDLQVLMHKAQAHGTAAIIVGDEPGENE